jgi:glycosyltransferase involved in cell wall biosynthesis
MVTIDEQFANPAGRFLKLYVAKYGRMPSYAEFLNFKDLPIFENGNPSPVSKSNHEIIHIDVTQMIYQAKITGIQRVVKAFLDLDDSRVKPIYFDKGNFYFYAKSSTSNQKLFTGFFQKFRKLVFNRIVLPLVSIFALLFQLFTNLLQLRSFTFYKKLESALKKLRNKTINMFYFGFKASNQVEMQDLQNSFFFLPDLPAERSHLEALLVLADTQFVKLTVFVHDLLPMTDPELMPPSSANEFYLYAKLLTKAKGFYCSSVKVRQDIEKLLDFHGVNQQSIIVKPFPLSKPTLQFPQSSFRKKYMQICEERYVLAIGTVFPRKNYSLVARALMHLELKDIACNFVVLAHHNWGDQSLVEATRLLNQNKIFVVYGVTDSDMRYFVDKASLIVFPSLAEGFGLPIVEAASSGKTVIVNPIEPMKSISQMNSGILVAPSCNSRDWADLIEEHLSGNFKNSVNLDKTFSISMTSWSTWGQDILQEILSNKLFD